MCRRVLAAGASSCGFLHTSPPLFGEILTKAVRIFPKLFILSEETNNSAEKLHLLAYYPTKISTSAAGSSSAFSADKDISEYMRRRSRPHRCRQAATVAVRAREKRKHAAFPRYPPPLPVPRFFTNELLLLCLATMFFFLKLVVSTNTLRGRMRQLGIRPDWGVSCNMYIDRDSGRRLNCAPA